MFGNRKSLVSFALASFAAGAIGFAGYAAVSNGASVARAADFRPMPLASKKEDVKNAISKLKEARDLLDNADHDAKGHDYKALQFTKQAIDECEAQIKKYDQKD